MRGGLLEVPSRGWYLRKRNPLTEEIRSPPEFGVPVMFANTHRSAKTVAPHIDNGPDNERAICFGSFRLLPAQGLLLDGDKPIRLGSRALDILIALVERAGELVTKDELMARVWPTTFVEPANLTVHIAALRRALRDDRNGNRFLINIPGRGYRFVAPIHASEELQASCPQPLLLKHVHNLPAPVTRLIGREDVVAGLSAQFCHDRFFTIVGPGGIGKTSVALAVAAKQIEQYRHGVWLIDLAPVCNSLLVPAAFASALGLESRADNPLPELIATFSDKQMLLVLDNCEHVITVIAGLAADILKGAAGVHILATSREPLRTEGERVYRLPPLQSPPVANGVCADEALRFSAVQLFVERTASVLGDYVLSDADAPIVADICLKLDGIPLAIEFAAARVACFGIGGLAARLDDPLHVLIHGSRTAHPRQQTMRATLDWSYDSLTEAEQTALRRLSLFTGDFTLQAAGTVISDSTRSGNQVIDQVTELVTKSLVAAQIGDAEPRLRLLGTTRAYAFAKLAESGELDSIAQRHVEYFGDTVPQRPSTRKNSHARAKKTSASTLC
jgi:predicted ATPase/DNA-binding winged helix-turn-helix (wHTH) protein